MKKDAYYFPHYSNARKDRKLRRVIKELGVEGYGIYFMILEVLRDETGYKYPLDDIDLLADEFGTSEQKLRTVISNYDLFQTDGDFFTSNKLIYYLQPYIEKSQRAREAANERWAKVKEEQSKSNANALPEQSKSNASKVKETKVKENIELRTKDFGKGLNDFKNLYSKQMLIAFYDYWTEPNKSNSKLRFEQEKTWDLTRRLKRWVDNEKN